MKLVRAQAIAARVIEKLAPFCDRIEVAGSVRRARPHCGDIDLVCRPKSPADRTALEAAISERCIIEKNGPENLVAKMADGTQLDLWIARGPIDTGDLLDKTVTPGNFGSILLCRTGSIDHNIALVSHAKTRGLRWHPHDGVMRREQVIAAETEEEIFDALSLRFIPVEFRERGYFNFVRWMRGDDSAR